MAMKQPLKYAPQIQKYLLRRIDDESEKTVFKEQTRM